MAQYRSQSFIGETAAYLSDNIDKWFVEVENNMTSRGMKLEVISFSIIPESETNPLEAILIYKITM